MKFKLCLALMGLCFVGSAQITKVGNDTLMDIACWNVEWFGDVSNGPSNEPLQFSNIKSVIEKTDIDVWGLAEMSNTTTFSELLTGLTAYDGVNSSFSQTQKMALLWKKSKFTLIRSGNVLTESTYNYEFAGRPPLEVVLVTNDNSVKNDTIYFYVVHLKANSGSSDQSSYDRRKNSSVTLKTFLDTNRKGQKCMVLGDWNDDVDQSVVYIGSAYLATPFVNFVNDSANYFYPTMALSKAGENSYVSSQNMIDHQLISQSLKDSFYVSGSSMAMKQTASQISGYANNTSDHYPILSRYNFNRHLPTPSTAINTIRSVEVNLYPNPSSDFMMIETKTPVVECYFVGMDGSKIKVEVSNNGYINTSQIPDGLYRVLIETEVGNAVVSCLVQHH